MLEASTAKTALELELGKLETEQLLSFSEWLKLFVPAAAKQDINVLNLILLSTRLARKSIILNRLLKSKKLHELGENSESARDMTWLCSLLHDHTDKLVQILNQCDQNTWSRIGNLLEEATLHERCLNLPLDLIVEAGEDDAADKAAQTPLEPIKRAIRYFKQIILINSSVQGETSTAVPSKKNLGDCRWLKRFIFRLEALSLYTTIDPNSSVNLDESAGSVTSDESEKFQKLVRSIKRKMPPPEGNATCIDLSIPNFEELESCLEKLISDCEVICPVNLSEISELLRNLVEQLQYGKLDIHEEKSLDSQNQTAGASALAIKNKSNIPDRAAYFHSQYDTSDGPNSKNKNKQVLSLSTELDLYKKEIKKLKEESEVQSVKIALLESEKNQNKKNTSNKEREWDGLKAKIDEEHRKAMAEKDKALDMLQAEVEKLEMQKMKKGSLASMGTAGLGVPGKSSLGYGWLLIFSFFSKI